MNKCFIDPDQSVVVKICATREIALREVEGAHVFQKFVHTSNPKRVDSKTLEMVLIDGKIGTAVPCKVLNGHVLDMFRKIVSEPVLHDYQMSPYSMYRHIRKLRKKYAYSADITSFLVQLEKDIRTKAFVPIHGDLQKQNMFINPSGELALIDFEHFCYAPIEFELVNSMFHSDGNCLDIQFLLEELRKITPISDELIRKALVLYTLQRV